MAKFDPTHHEFVKLLDFQFPGGVNVFEFRNHSAANGTHDFLRVNIYLSKDEDFVCIWHGLLDAAIAESMLPATALPPDFDFVSAYNTDLFRGYLQSDDNASIVVKSLRIGGDDYAVHRLQTDARDGLTCDALADSYPSAARKS